MWRASFLGRGASLLLCVWMAVACTPEVTATQLLVVVDSDLSVNSSDPDALRTIQIAVMQADNEQAIVPRRPLVVSDQPRGPAEFLLPLSFALTPDGLDEGSLFRVVVTGQNSLGEEIVERQVVTAFRTGASLRLDVFLAATCLRELCRADGQRTTQTCAIDSGACAPVPEVTDLPIAETSGVSGYTRPQTRGEGGAGEQGDGGVAQKCATHAECDDGLYCNGSEQCDPGSVKANALGCVVGIALSCGAQQTCDEGTDRCTACAQTPDGDGDNVNAKACGGSDCNDGDPAIAPNRTEICDGKDNDCDEMTDMRSGVSVCSGADAGGPGSGTGDGGIGIDGGTRGDGGIDGGSGDAGRDGGPSDGGMDATADSSVPLTAGCTMRSTAACSSFINAWDAEVSMGSYGAVMEPNVGQGFEVAASTSDTASACSSFLGVYGLSPAQIQELNDLGTVNLALHTVYRPARWLPGEKYPLIIWGNGTCMQPETYGGHLRSLASQGFIVVAPNSRYVASGGAMANALSFAIAANSAQGAFNGRIDTTKIGVMGHGQGAGATITLAADSRVQAALMFNGGTSAQKPFLAISGDRDVSGTVAQYQSAVSAAPKGAYIFYHMVPGTGSSDGALTLLTQPGRVTGATNAWWKYLLNNDTAARTWFVGTSCTLCGHAAEYEFGQNGL